VPDNSKVADFRRMMRCHLFENESEMPCVQASRAENKQALGVV
jgi:hypothetical protein